MKILIFALVILSLTSCQNNSNNTKKGILVESTNNQVELVKQLSDKILTSQKLGGYYSLSENEASLKMVTVLNESLQKSTYKKIKSMVGDYQGLEFHSMEEIKEQAQSYQVYRFLGDFSFGSKVEIRSVLNNDGKLAGFFVKPWNDKL